MKVLFSLFLILSLTLHENGVSGVGKDDVFVSRGDSVTLHTGVKTNQQYIIVWLYEGIRIAVIRGDLSYICTDVQCNNGTERFRDRLKLDHPTGSLTVINTRLRDAGEYQSLIFSSFLLSKKIFRVVVHGDFCADANEESVSVMEGNSVTLHTGSKTNKQNSVKWYFNNILIAEITGDLSKICEDDWCKERFRNRLKLDHQTGSLTIMNIRTTDSGCFQLIIHNTMKSFGVAVTSSYRDKNRLPVLVMEGDALTLLTDVKMNQHDRIIWEFQYTQIAEITGDLRFICTDVQCNKDAERFRDRLKLDNQTGSLTIMNISNTHSGLYCLKIFKSNYTENIFSVTVDEEQDEVKRKSVKEGESVTLHPGEKNKRNKTTLLKWFFNATSISVFTDGANKTCKDDQCDERFRNKLKVDNQTGSLTIMNSRTEHAGLYILEIIYSRFNISRNFTVIVIAGSNIL